MDKARLEQPPATPPTLGLLLRNGISAYESALWAGVVDAARERGINLICVAGGLVRSPYGCEAEGNTLYSYVGPQNVHGLIIASAIGSHDREALEKLIDTYRPLPLVTVGPEWPGLPGVTVDIYADLLASMRHLKEKHRCRRFAFIRGPEGHQESEMRYRAYSEALSQLDLKFDPDLIAPGDFLPASGAEAVRLLSGQRKVKYDAVVAANEMMAFGVMEALQVRGLRTPGDVAVMHFLDEEISEMETRPRTPIRSALYAAGRRSVEKTLALLGGETLPPFSPITLPPTMRCLCGCPAAAAPAKPETPLKSKEDLTPHARALQKLQAERQTQMLRETSQALTSTFDTPRLLDAAVRHLPQLDISACYLAMYETPEASTEWAKLLLAYTEKGRQESSGQRFASRELLPAELWPRGQRYALMVEPLYFRNDRVGFALFDIGPRNPLVYEILRREFSSALRGAMLVQQVQRQSADLTSANTQLRLAHDELEQRVAERTAELSQANASLKEQMAGRQRAEAATTHGKREWEATFDIVSDIIILTDADGRILRCNRATIQRLQTTFPEVIGHSIDSLLSGETAPAAPLSQSEKTERQIPRLPGWFEVSSYALRVEGELLGVVYFIKDVSQRRESEQALREAHAQNAQLLTAIPSILIGVGPDEQVTHWNAAAEEAFGIPAAAVLGQPFAQCGLRWNWETILPGLADCRAERRPRRLDDVAYTRPDNKEGFLNLIVNPLPAQTDQPGGYLLLGEEITERKILENQLAQAQKLKSIGQLAAGIAHEVNTPAQYVGDNLRFLQQAFATLLTMRQNYERLLRAAQTGEIAPELVAEIRQAVAEADLTYLELEIPAALSQSLQGIESISRIVRAMKEFSHPGIKEKVSIDINKAIESTITVARNEWKYVAEVEMDLDPNLPPVPCFPGELTQVILNLLVNAAHAIAAARRENATDQKGTITVSTRRQAENRAEIRVRDTGIGIPEEVRSRIFDPFFTTKGVGEGTGQGLAIAHSVIVEKHGGAIAFETEVGRGTTFIIQLPLRAASPAAAVTTPAH